MITISRPTPEDAEGMNEVIKLSWYATYVTPEIGVTKEDIDLMYAKSEKGQMEAFRRRAGLSKNDDITLVAKGGEKVIGIIRLVDFPDHIRVRTLYVHPLHVGKGIGTKLWNEAIRLMPSYKPVITYPAEHTKSVDWYKKMGFVETGEKLVGQESMEKSAARLVGIKMIFKRTIERILVMGRSGSGKSILAGRLGEKFGLPVFHMDRLFWLPGWVERPKTEMAIDVEKILVDNKGWVIDGNYRRVALESRIRAADLIIILDFGFLVSIWRVLKRNIIHWNKTRPDMQDDCVERFNFEFVKYIWTYPERTLRPIENDLSRFPEKTVLRFNSQRALDRWMKSL